MANLTRTALWRGSGPFFDWFCSSRRIVSQGRRQILLLDWSMLAIFEALRRYPLRSTRLLRVLILPGAMLCNTQLRFKSNRHAIFLPDSASDCSFLPWDPYGSAKAPVRGALLRKEVAVTVKDSFREILGQLREARLSAWKRRWLKSAQTITRP